MSLKSKRITSSPWKKKIKGSSSRILLLLFSRWVMSNSLQPHGLQHTRLPCPSPSPGVCSNSCPLSQWCHPAISSFVPPSPPAFCKKKTKQKQYHSYYCKVVRPVWPTVCGDQMLTHSCWAESLPVALYQLLLRWSRGNTPSSHLVLLLQRSWEPIMFAAGSPPFGTMGACYYYNPRHGQSISVPKIWKCRHRRSVIPEEGKLESKSPCFGLKVEKEI